MNRPIRDSSRFRLEFDWTGTRDMTGFCTLPTLIDYMNGISDSGWAGITARNHTLAVEGRDLICQALDLEAPCPVEMIGSLATICLPGLENLAANGYLTVDPLKEILRQQYGIEVSLSVWPSPPGRYLRVSAQLYNSLQDYERLINALQLELAQSE